MDDMAKTPGWRTGSIDWEDPAFNNSDFHDSMAAQSPWASSAFNEFTNLADYSDSPAGTTQPTPTKAEHDSSASAPASRRQIGLPIENSTSADSSSQDSSADASSPRKRKTASESPNSDPLYESNVANIAMGKDNLDINANGFHKNRAFQQTFTQPMSSMNVDGKLAGHDDTFFNFSNAASTPNLPQDFNQQLSLDSNINLAAAGYIQESPAPTINPGMFALGGSRDQSPATSDTLMFNAASPNAMFSTPSSDSTDAFGTNQNWSNNIGQTPQWPVEFNTQSPALVYTPSPVENNSTLSGIARASPPRAGLCRLHIAPISTKSRVETQINIIMTLEKPPPGIEHLHLPLHTIAKSKLLAKDDYDLSKVLELHTMLVCTSAMHNAAAKERAFQRAAAQNNQAIQRRAELASESGEVEKVENKNLDEGEKAVNGGEVRICSNCIQRERKRAARKKLKKEEEQMHWERFETERVVVFNSNEYLPFKPVEPRENATNGDESYHAPDGAITVAAAVRIACYCRHQSEKEGFQVIFTLKDHVGKVIAQEISDSILITDDHKTQPPTLTAMSSDMLFHAGQLGPHNGLPTSYSMMDLPSQSQPFTASRSAGNLQALAYGQQMQFNPHSHVHQVSNNGYTSQTASASVTPTSLSRPGSPTSAGQTGPNKKRKSASFHKKVPSGLQMTQMTPRPDRSRPSSATLQSSVSMGSNFSPVSTSYGQQSDQSYMTIPTNNGPAQFYGSGPPTPVNENLQMGFGHPHQLDMGRAQNASAYFSHPSSAVPSRSNSPVLQHTRPNLSAFQRSLQNPPNHARGLPQQMYSNQTTPVSASSDNEPASSPSITKITPPEGPVNGGTEVSIFGYNFTHSTQIMFGDTIAPTTFYGPQSILAISPPGRKGGVRVRLVPSHGSVQYAPQQTSNPVFTYTEANPQIMEMALRLLAQQQTGDAERWAQYTNELANQFVQTSISPGGMQGQGYHGRSVAAPHAAADEHSPATLERPDPATPSDMALFRPAKMEHNVTLACWLWIRLLLAISTTMQRAALLHNALTCITTSELLQPIYPSLTSCRTGMERRCSPRHHEWLQSPRMQILKTL